MCQVFCVNGRFFPCAAGILGGGKVGILILDFHFPMAHSSSSFLVFSSKIVNRFARICTGTPGNRAQRGARPKSWLSGTFFGLLLSFRLIPVRLAERGLPAESRNAVRPPSSSAPASSTF